MKNEKYQMYENVKSKMLYHSAIGCPAYTQSTLLGEMMMIMVIMLILVTPLRKAPWDKFNVPIYLFQPKWPV